MLTFRLENSTVPVRHGWLVGHGGATLSQGLSGAETTNWAGKFPLPTWIVCDDGDGPVFV